MKDNHTHTLDVACIECVRLRIKELEKLKRFVMDIAMNYRDDCNYSNEAMELLKEINER